MVPSLATSPVQSVPLRAQLVPKVGGHVPPVPNGSGATEWGSVVLLSMGRGAGSSCNAMSPGSKSTFVPSGILIRPAIWPHEPKSGRVVLDGDPAPTTERGTAADRQFYDIIIVIYIHLDTFNRSQLGCQNC